MQPIDSLLKLNIEMEGALRILAERDSKEALSLLKAKFIEYSELISKVIGADEKASENLDVNTPSSSEIFGFDDLSPAEDLSLLDASDMPIKCSDIEEEISYDDTATISQVLESPILVDDARSVLPEIAEDTNDTEQVNEHDSSMSLIGIEDEEPELQTPQGETLPVEEPELQAPQTDSLPVEEPELQAPQAETPLVEEPELQAPEAESLPVEEPELQASEAESLPEKLEIQTSETEGRKEILLNDAIPTTLKVDEMLSKQNCADLSKAFTINDKFRFVRGIFCDDQKDFDDTISTLSNLKSLDEAYDYLLNEREWDVDNEDVRDFISIIANYFNQN